MAKRAAPDEKPYRPLLDAELVNAALQSAGPASSQTPSMQHPASSAKVLEMPRMEPSRRMEMPPVEPETFSDTLSRPLELEQARQAVHALVEKFAQEKRILSTRSESQAIDRLVMSLATRRNA